MNSAPSSQSRSQFVASLRHAIDTGSPFAAAKLGISEKHWMYYPLFLSQRPSPAKHAVFLTLLRHHGLELEGVFPHDPAFYLEFNRFFVERVRQIDVLGLVFDPLLDPALLEFYHLDNPLLPYKDLLPEKWAAGSGDACYLDAFAGRTILVICPYARFLQERATQETFERVWARARVPWFHPREVKALDIPFGIAEETWRHYPNAIDLFEAMVDQVAGLEFDVALIAAGGLALPLTAAVKRFGRVGIHLGGNLQVLFGVAGSRWRRQAEWRDRYLNDAWIDLPAHFRPPGTHPRMANTYWG